MDYLIICGSDFWPAHKVFKHKPVLDFADSEYGVPSLVVVGHSSDDRGHIGEFLLVFCLCPLVLAFREILLVVFHRVVIDVKQVFKVVKAYDIVLLGLLSGTFGGNGCRNQECGYCCQGLFHFVFCVIFCQRGQANSLGSVDSTSAAWESPIFAGRFTKRSMPILFSSSSMEKRSSLVMKLAEV